jgi:hypothetical protein
MNKVEEKIWTREPKCGFGRLKPQVSFYRTIKTDFKERKKHDRYQPEM